MKYINDNYAVTADGEIWSKPRLGTKGGFLKKILHTNGYHLVMLAPCRVPKKVHRLVAEAFIPNPSNLPFVNHKDGNKTNNCVDNLEWCTNKYNMQHAFRTGLANNDWNRGVNNPSTKLTPELVRYIREVYVPYNKEFGARALGRKLGVAKSTIISAYSGKDWNYI